MEQFINQCNKKAYKHIKHIQSAHNMLEAESAINSAIMHTFGTHNLGLIKIAMRHNYYLLLKEYGAGHYTNFEALKAMRKVEQEIRILDKSEVIKGLPTIRREYKIPVYNGIRERFTDYPIEYRAECLSGLKTVTEFELMILN